MSLRTVPYILISSILVLCSQAFAEESAQDQDLFARGKAVAALVHRDVAEKTKSIAEEETSTESSLVKVTQGLFLCCGVFLMGVWAYKKYVLKDQQDFAQRIRVIDRAAISQKSHLVLAEVDGQRVLLAVGLDTVTSVPFAQKRTKEVLEFKDSLQMICGEETQKIAS
ncbi:MAG: flagellar biosynthetic protein FliO [Bdellovibrionales bacterium]|nr:flagellar biosynthetic protein FliO [Bdellovibrionales bacterium]